MDWKKFAWAVGAVVIGMIVVNAVRPILKNVPIIGKYV